MIEIERKFLVTATEFKTKAIRTRRIVQGYLNSAPERAVRIRIQDSKAFLTIKGKSNTAGTSRFEWEKEIPLSEAETLLQLCEPGKISKIRYEIPIGKHTYEVDEFFEENEGLILSEIELSSENETFDKPTWLGKEVTGDVRYYNSQLSKNPYTSW